MAGGREVADAKEVGCEQNLCLYYLQNLMRRRSRDNTSQLRCDARCKNGFALQKIVVLTADYPPKIDCIDEGWDRTTGISRRERYGAPKTTVVKEEMQGVGIFKERIKAATCEGGLEWRCDLGYNLTHSSCATWADNSSVTTHAIELEE
jgi:hypothetical protein